MIPRRPRELIADTRASGRALAAFNVNNLETVQAVLAAAEDAGSAVILQISPGAIDYAGYESIRSIAMSEAERAKVAVLVHLDHCRDPELVRRALDDGFSSVMFDGSAMPLEQNVKITAALVQSAHERDVAVEAELGLIGGVESTTLEEASQGVTTPAEAAAFVAATDVDLLAPALGSLHRMPDDSVTLDIELVGALARAAERPLALHGGSGVRRDELPALIAAGIGKVNVSSRVSRSLAAGIRDTWRDDPDALDLRRYLGAGRERVRAMAAEYMTICRRPTGNRTTTASRWSSTVVEAE